MLQSVVSPCIKANPDSTVKFGGSCCLCLVYAYVDSLCKPATCCDRVARCVWEEGEGGPVGGPTPSLVVRVVG